MLPVPRKLLHQLLFDRQFDRFHPAVNAELVEDIRDMEFDRAKTDDKPFRDFVIVESLYHAFENIAFTFGQLLTADLRLRN